MLRSVSRVTREALDGLSTDALLGRLGHLRALEDTWSWGTWSAEQVAAVEGIAFKDDPEWRAAYDDVKAVLAEREHVPGPAARTRARHARAALNGTSDRRNGRQRP